jgi:hypothetical protein
MENEDYSYIAVDAQGNYDYASYIRRELDANPYGTRNIDLEGELALVAAREVVSGHLGTTWSGKYEKSPQPDSFLKETLTNLKLGLKPYYQEKIPYYIEGSDDGAYIEYVPEEGIDLRASQKIQWMLPSLVDKINLLYEGRKKAREIFDGAAAKYKDDVAELDRAIENYRTNGHNYLL